MLLLERTSLEKTPTKFWASDSNRVIETAKHFAAGFFGIDYNIANKAILQVISEHSSLGADTLTPGRTCLANKKDEIEGQRKGYRLLNEYRASYMPAIRERLAKQTDMYETFCITIVQVSIVSCTICMRHALTSYTQL